MLVLNVKNGRLRFYMLPTPDKTYYKPEGQDEYLNIKGNYDQIYKRLKKLEDGM